MYLKSLEIHGFKSFPDKINLTFDKGLTAVVGPNGSGKSNIGDSVRWVLGEQSTKTLRGNKMEDVIFSGTVARKPMGFASVTLNIDNSDGTLSDMGEEIAVTRKLYRSGESEYMINGRSVRLKDINELFMDTGLGRDGYSIIGQGRIAEIVGAKSSERRDIFEEASGISKFRYRKIEAERKLTSAQENLLRLTDILSELESRIEPLRIQSQKAEKFLKLSEEKKTLEISVWVNRLDEMKKSLERLEEKILVSRTEYENIENDIREQEKKLEDGYRKMQESTIRSDEIRRKMLEEEKTASEMKSGIAVLENDIKHSGQSVLSYENDMAGYEKTRLTLTEQRENILKNIESLESERLELERKISETEKNLRQAEAENLRLSESTGRSGADINALYIRQSEYRFSCESAGKVKQEETARLASLRENSAEHEMKISEYAEKIKQAETELENIRTKSEELEKSLPEREKIYSSKREDFRKSASELEKNGYKLREEQQKSRILHDLENNMEGFAGSVKAILKASKNGRINGVYGTVAQNMNVDQKYAVAVETALGGAMQNIIVENEESAKQCIEFLKQQKSGRATFLPLTSIRGRELTERGLEECEGFIDVASHIADCDGKFKEIISSLLGRTVIAENINTATEIAKKYGYRFRIVTTDGQIINAGGSFTGGSVQKISGIITRKNEINFLDSDIKRLSAEHDALHEKNEKLRTETESLFGEIEKIKAGITSFRNENIRVSAEISALRSLSEQIRSQTGNTAGLIEEAEKKISSAEKDMENYSRLLAEIGMKIKTAENELEAEKNIREVLGRNISELSESLSALKIKHTGIVKDIQAKKSDISRTAGNLEELEKNKAVMTDNIEKLKKSVAEKNAEIIQIRQRLESLHDNTESYLNQIKHYQTQHTEQNRLVNELQRNLKQTNAEKEHFSGEITRLEERRENISRDSDNIIKQLLEVYELTRSEAVGMAEKIDDMLSAQKKLSEIKNKIKALGSVNVDSIDEYREVSERYDFMSGQIADVQKSKAELERIISGLTEEMKRIFSESFDIINENFKGIFTELFGGGKAELVLTDPENVLTSGIEIIVAPPGKVIKNLISLSGGEQSFVAIAIYFAILKLRPAPFCILDEIDAALDEVNVRKYAQYLRKFTDTTQFVLVTHRRSAMEEANVLYGVTMQEDGISKLLKMEQVDFQEDIADIH
ncbi:MAG: chromosome segregation protein SMC [Ruminococcus flavefaciens]|nr:chromosome segregation protein SMC [Ruminococcus flavefaciens]